MGQLPNIPEYFKKHVNAKVDLDLEPSQPCPFHHETEGKSLTYSKDKQVISCWGKCHFTGGVYRLHQANFHLPTLEDAKKSLNELYGIDDKPTFEKTTVTVNTKDIGYRARYSLAVSLATTPKDWVELDYIMSMSPVDTLKLDTFISIRKRAR